jgi:hypothetical protein
MTKDEQDEALRNIRTRIDFILVHDLDFEKLKVYTYWYEKILGELSKERE